MDKQEVLRKVQALLEKAESTGFTAEADACRAKADSLMMAYSIEMWELDQRRTPEQRGTPEIRVFDISLSDNPVSHEMRLVFSTLCNHWQVKPVFVGWMGRPYRKGDLPRRQFVEVVGFPQELDWLELMFTTIRLHIGVNLEPKRDPALDFESNLVIMKEAGMKWERIHQLLRPDVPWSRTHGVKYTKMYTEYCARIGKERLNISPLVYQRNFVNGYQAKISSRLYDIRQRRVQQQQDGGSGMELMLRDKSSLIEQMFNEAFTGLSSLKYKGVKYEPTAFGQGVAAGANADLGQNKVGGRSRELEG